MTEAPAIFLLANDRVLANIVQLLHSLRVHGFTNKVFCIEFNEETYFLKKVCRVFGVQNYDVGLKRIDSLGRRIFDRDPPARPYPYCLGKLRAFRTRAVTEAGLFPENLGRVRGLLLSNEELLVTKRIRDLGYTVFYDPKIEMHHRVHPDRVSQSWLRRRVFWQVLSDLFIGDQLQPCRADDDIRRILDFLMKLTPRDRGAMGLFLDTDDAQLFEAQTEAIGALARLLANECGDWRSFLAEGEP